METLRLPMLCTPLVDHEEQERAHQVAEVQIRISSLWSNTEGVRIPRGIGNLKDLQILEGVDIRRTGKKAVKELGGLIQLRKLSVVVKGRCAQQKRKILYLCGAIEKLSSLCSLGVDAEYEEIEWLCNVSFPPLLKNLKLVGDLGGKMPEWVGSLKHLVKIHLEWSKLKEGQITGMLGELPKLMQLSLHVFASRGEKLVFREKLFLNLRKLSVWHLGDLREVRFEKGASPQMEMLEFSVCYLESGIIGINHLPVLKQISLGRKARVAKLGMLQTEVDTYPSHPVLRLKGDRSEHDFGEIVQGCDDGEAEEEPSQFTEHGAVRESSSQATNLSPDHDIGDEDFLSCISENENPS